MVGLRTRRKLALTLTLSLCAVAGVMVWWASIRLGHIGWMTGYMLLASTVGLFGLSARKRTLPLPFGRVAAWFQSHLYLGIFGLWIFWLHVGWTVNGWFEVVLAINYLSVAVTGIAVAYLTRTTPKKLSAVGDDVLLEHIPYQQLRLAQNAYETAAAAASTAESSVLAQHYQHHLITFFQEPRSIAFRVIPNGRLRRQLLHDMEDLDRYLSPDGRIHRRTLADLVFRKDDLDYRQALQLRLRAWYTAHVASTWLLVLLITLHVIMVHRFHGGI